jgi:hypothetical protein
MFLDCIKPEIEVFFDRGDPGVTSPVVGADCFVAIVVVAAFLEGDDEILSSIFQ